MKSFNYYQPTEIRFGRGRLAEVGQAVARFGRRCLLLTVPESQEFSRLYNKVKDLLHDKDIGVTHFDGVIPNPTTVVVSDAAEMARQHKVDVVLGLGGGSSMDTAKAVAVEASHTGTCWDYLFFRNTQPTDKTLPVVAVTTTSGTGSHVTQVAVVTNPAERSKSALYNPILYPRISIVDPELMLTVPPHVTAATGFDVLAHAFQSYINPNESPYTDLMAPDAMRLVAANLPGAVRRSQDISLRAWMAWADTLAGLCIANSGVTLPHGMGMAMGGLYPHVAHGEALAVIYPAIMRYTYRSAPAKYAALARIFDPSLEDASEEKAAEKSCDLVDSFLKDIGLWTCLEDYGIPEEDLRQLAEASLVLPDYKNHPRIATVDEVLALLKKSCRVNKTGSGMMIH